MRNNLQRYIEATYTEALGAGCDIVQYKYQGEFKRYDEGGSGSNVLLGNILTGPHWEGHILYNKMCVWDCLAMEGTSVRAFTYRDRWSAARHICLKLGDPFFMVQNFAWNHTKTLWEFPYDFTNGVIYRSSKAPFDTPILMARQYKEVPGALP